jgi:hypothetical protein
VQVDHSAIDVGKWLNSYFGRFTRWEGSPAHIEEEAGLASDIVRALFNGGKSLVAPGFLWEIKMRKYINK